MKKYNLILTALFIFTLVFGSLGCAKPATDLPKNTLVYVSYQFGDYSLHFVDSQTLKDLKKIKIGEGYGYTLLKDNKGRYWAPLDFKSDSTTPENHVLIYDPKTDKTVSVKVGFHPTYLFLQDDVAYVLCAENGFTPSLYKIDADLKPTLIKRIDKGGLVAGAQFDGKYIYFGAISGDPKDMDKAKELPQIVRVSLDGNIKINELSNANHGIGTTLLLDGKLYMGLPEVEGNLVEIDRDSLKIKRTLPYKDTLGMMQKIDEHSVYVTTSSINQSKSTISVLDMNTGKTIKTYKSNLSLEHLSDINGTLYTVDNGSNKIETISKVDGSSKQFTAPSMVSNLIEAN